MGLAASLFSGARAETLIGRITPSKAQREFLVEQWNELCDFIVPRLQARSGRQVSTWLQGSYKFGTLIKPIHKDDEYDVDVGVYFEWLDADDDSPTPARLRAWVQEELKAYAAGRDELRSVDEPPKPRCSRGNYRRQFHIDLPTYHLETDTVTRRLAVLPNRWEESDPKKIYVWFRDCVADQSRDQLRRIVRYLKAWGALTFRDARQASRPSSILLTVAAAEAFTTLGLDRGGPLADDDALTAVVRALHDRLARNRSVPNPVDLAEDLNRLGGREWGDFLDALGDLRAAADRANAAADEAAAAIAWAEVFSYLMPLPEAEAVELVESNGLPVATMPEVEVQVLDPAGRLLATHRNAVPHVPKGCELVFRITNPSSVPAMGSVEWIVRNEGSEADDLHDLGHVRSGPQLLTAREHTAYTGRHFMDVVVRGLGGDVLSVRRIPVTVSPLPVPQRNPPKPVYARLRSHFRRR